jgi:uncharacterized membrane protein YadS
MGLRTAGAVPEAVLPPLNGAITLLTLTAMAALGLGVDPRALVRAGPRVAAVAVLSLLLVALMAVAVIALALPG